jgi:pimeloyl-ACP methyl ester carboxylesterase
LARKGFLKILIAPRRSARAINIFRKPFQSIVKQDTAILIDYFNQLQSMLTGNPDFILYAQHGWADDDRAIAEMAHSLANTTTQVVAPNLGYLKTFIRIEPLIQTVEKKVLEIMARYPTVPMRIIGHSMGGLIWIELLHRHPEWWSQVESLVLVGSPVGGADLARIIDPFGIGIGMARDLGCNRRAMAEAIAAQIPTLIIAGDVDGGSDGVVPIGATKFQSATFVCLPNIAHAGLKNHAKVAETIRNFWDNLDNLPTVCEPSSLCDRLISRLQSVPGMTDAHCRDFPKAKVWATFPTGGTLRTWKNPMGINHVFVADCDNVCLYSGFVGWAHAAELHKTLAEIQRELPTQEL